MNAFLTELGVPTELQAFFNSDDLQMNPEYDETNYDNSFYTDPAGADLWLAGDETAPDLVITSSALEAIAFMTVNAYRYPVPDTLLFIAVGDLPHARQLNWIRANRQKRKITLVFSNDLLGSLLDITVVAGLTGKSVRLRWTNGMVTVTAGTRRFDASPDTLTLNSFERSAGFRSGVRTRKPHGFNTFLEQLKHDSQE